MRYYLPGAGKQRQLQLGSVWLISPGWGGEVQGVVGAQNKGLIGIWETRRFTARDDFHLRTEGWVVGSAVFRKREKLPQKLVLVEEPECVSWIDSLFVDAEIWIAVLGLL